MLEGYQNKAFSITVAEEVVAEEADDEFYLTDEMKAIINNSINRPEETDYSAAEVAKILRSHYES